MSSDEPAGRRLTGALGAVAGLNLAVAASAHVMVVVRVGANSVSDAYFAALVVPQLLTGVFFGAILNATVPHLTERGDGRRAEARSTLLGVLGTALVVAAMVGLAAPVLVRLVAPGFATDEQALTVTLLRIGVLGAVAAAGTAVATAWHQSRGRFLGPEIAGTAGNAVFLVGTVALVTVDRVETAAWLNVASYTVPLLVLALPLIHPGTGPSPVTAVRDLGRRVRPLVGLGALQQAEPAVERALVSLGPAGGVALYSLARQLLTGGLLVLDKAVAAPALPALTRSRSGAAFDSLLRRSRRRAAGLASLTLAATAVGGLVLIGPVSGPLALSEHDLGEIWHLAMLMGGGLVFGSVFIVTSKACYARGDPMTPTRLAALAFPFGIALRVGGNAVAGAAGVAVAVSVQWAGLALALDRSTGRRWSNDALDTRPAQRRPGLHRSRP